MPGQCSGVGRNRTDVLATRARRTARHTQRPCGPSDPVVLPTCSLAARYPSAERQSGSYARHESTNGSRRSMSTSCRALTHLAHAIRRALHAQVLHSRPWRGSRLWTAAARTRLGVGKFPLALRSRSIVQKDRAATGTAGSRSHDRKVRPSRGNAARRTAACRWTRRQFVFVSATITQALTASGSQPRSRAMRAASRRLRSTVR